MDNISGVWRLEPFDGGCASNIWTANDEGEFLVAENLDEKVAIRMVREHNAHEELVQLAKHFHEHLEACGELIAHIIAETLSLMGNADEEAKELLLDLAQTGPQALAKCRTEIEDLLARAKGRE